VRLLGPLGGNREAGGSEAGSCERQTQPMSATRLHALAWHDEHSGRIGQILQRLAHVVRRVCAIGEAEGARASQRRLVVPHRWTWLLAACAKVPLPSADVACHPIAVGHTQALRSGARTTMEFPLYDTESQNKLCEVQRAQRARPNRRQTFACECHFGAFFAFAALM